MPKGTEGRFHLLPVDYVSAAITGISGSPVRSAVPSTFFNQSSLALSQCVELLRSLGYELDEVDWGHLDSGGDVR
ncbi:hypothetical protein ACQ9NK_31190 [Streptomyces lividans]